MNISGGGAPDKEGALDGGGGAPLLLSYQVVVAPVCKFYVYLSY